MIQKNYGGKTAATGRGQATKPLKYYLLLAFIFFMSPLSISFGDSQATFSVLNKTGYFLHVYINGEPYLYLAPMRRATLQSATITFDVTAFYAPGQGVSGVIDRIFDAPYTAPSTHSSGCKDDSDNNSNLGCECSKSTTPADYGSVIWEVTADTMAVAEF
jgi:hypothetical protein